MENKKSDESQKLNKIFEEYFEELIRLFPIYASYIGDKRYDDKFANDISEEHRDQQKKLFDKYLSQISGINRDLLFGQDRLSYDIFKRDMVLGLEGFQFNDHLIPVNQFHGTPTFFAEMGSGNSLHPFKTVKDYNNFLERVKGFQVWVDTAIGNMRKGIGIGVVQPRVLMEKTLPQFEAHLVKDIKDSVFYNPIKKIPSDFAGEEKTRLAEEYSEAIKKQIIPTYKKLYDFIKDEYLSECRESIGLSELPDGENWYSYEVRIITTTNLTPDEIFEIGKDEIKRIKKEINRIKEKVGFKGEMQDFFEYLKKDENFYFSDKESLLNGYEDLRESVESKLPELFKLIPKAGFEIKPVEKFREKSAAGAQYMGPAPDGSRPGVFYVNTYDLKAHPKYGMTTLFLHEVSPGHHFQISLQQEQEDLPKFRRFGGYTGYVEGWALYAESLGKEMGLYKDPYQYYGHLSAEMFRAIRLVVDVAIHMKRWSREKALTFFMENLCAAPSESVAEIERYIAIPGQALSYKIGQLEISKLRAKAEKELGSKFDIKALHDEILKDGALPLDVLEVKMDEWIGGFS
ncbi:DUF885 domain-containing protein [candidate division WOR-3 bacterium]|nr:DUF885 domain-containing protein [candidate division WOR-3 bacterium]